MKYKTPLITLGAGMLVTLILYALNVTLTRPAGNDAAEPAPAAAATTTPAEVATPTPTEEPTPTPEPTPTRGDGSGPAAQNGTVTYAGWVDGDAATLAIVVNNGKALAYVCDGVATEAWLQGTMADGLIELTGDAGSLTGTYGGGQITGDVTAAGRTWHFTIGVAEPPSGAYRTAEGLRDELDSSWVVVVDDAGNTTQTGVDRTGGTRRPAQPFDLSSGSITVDGTRVAVDPVQPQ